MGKVKQEVKDFLGRHTNEEQKEFFATAGKAFYPNAYGLLNKRKVKQALSYLFSFVFVCFAVMAILSIPKLLVMPTYIEKQMAKFNQFGITVNVDTKEPVLITNSSPYLIADTTGKYNNLSIGKFLLTKDSLYYQKFGRQKVLNLGDYSNFVGKETRLNRLWFCVFIFMMPSIALFLYAIYLIKYIFIILLSALIAFGVTRAVKVAMEFKKLVVVAVYSSSIMIALEIITIPFFLDKYLMPFTIFFNISIGLIPLALFLCIYSIVIILLYHKGEVKMF